MRLTLVSEQGPWPEPGGLLDQSLWFVGARGVVLRELNAWRERRALEAQVGKGR